MKEFNYQDYLKYQKLKVREKVFQLREPEVPFKVDKPHDKIFKIVLSEKRQVVGLLNRVLKLSKELTKEDIEKYSTEHIDYMFQGSESDIVYRMKEKEIFFLIEHQQKIDYNMPRRILEYEVEIIKEAVKGKKMTKKSHKLPTVIPIVIYTGRGRWNVERYIKECQEKLSEADSIKLGEYYVVDVNDYTNEELEKSKWFLSKMLLLEKLEKEEDIFNMLSQTIREEDDEENRNMLKRIIAFILYEKLNSKNRQELLKKIEEGGEKDMVLEVIRKENEKQRREGRKEGRKEGRLETLKEFVSNMTKRNMTIDEIQEITGISKDELEQIQNMLIEI